MGQTLTQLTTILLILGVILLAMAGGRSFRLRRQRFPTLYVVCLALFLVCFLLCAAALAQGPPQDARTAEAQAGLTSSEHSGDEQGPPIVLMIVSGALGILTLGLPALHRLSGFRPAELDIRLRLERPGLKAELTDVMKRRVVELGFELAPPEPWEKDLVAIRRRSPWDPSPRMLFASLAEQGAELLIRVLVDVMDIVVFDNKETDENTSYFL